MSLVDAVARARVVEQSPRIPSQLIQESEKSQNLCNGNAPATKLGICRLKLLATDMNDRIIKADTEVYQLKPLSFQCTFPLELTLVSLLCQLAQPLKCRHNYSTIESLAVARHPRGTATG